MKFPVMWMRLENGDNAGPLPISSGGEILISDKRFSLEVDEDASSYTLLIKGIKKSDNAKYQCKILISSDGSVAEDVEVKIKLPPVIKDGTGRTKMVKEGEPVELGCEAGGFPSPTITWTRKDRALLPSGKASFKSSRMPIPKVRREDRGIYVCTADNGVGTSQEKSVALEVEFSPKIKVPSPRTPQTLYHEARLLCEIEAFPPPAINWKKDNQTIRNNGTFHVTHFASADEKTTSQLKVLETTTDTYGVYECEAKNRLGGDSQQLVLYKSKLPILQTLDLENSSMATFKPNGSPFFSFLLSIFISMMLTILFL